MFLRKYSDASSTEVGTLLMILPFIAVFTKPFFCALADRHRRYRLYFILSLLFTLIGFGSYTFLPFFPEFISSHGRLAWWLLVCATVIGYIAYGVAWSLGDAYAANVSHRTGESFGLIRLWGTIGWGVAGAIVGSVSPYLHLPEMILGILIFVATFIFEIILLALWPHADDFEMGDAVPGHGPDGEPAAQSGSAVPVQQTSPTINSSPVASKQDPYLFADNQRQQQVGAGLNLSQQATVHSKPEQKPINENTNDNAVPFFQLDLNKSQFTIQRTKSNSLHITTKFKLDDKHLPNLDAILDKFAFSNDLNVAEGSLWREQRAKEQRQQIASMQTDIFKMVALRHKSLFKYLLLFVALGTVYNIHWSYFFLHLDQLAAEGKGGDFSTLVGLCLVAQAVGETFCFIIAPWVVAKLGRDGAISLNAITYAVRYFGNGLGIPLVSPYVAILTESLQGINYGIFYYLITDTALYYALLVDEVIPELEARQMLPKDCDLNMVRTSLRATMQGVFSGAFDGLGFGLGSLIAGLVLESHGYEQLWCYTATAATAIFALHALYETINRLIRSRLAASGSRRRSPLQPQRSDEQFMVGGYRAGGDC